MSENNKNIFLAAVLTIALLFGWQYFVAMPQMKANQARQSQTAATQKTTQTNEPASVPGVPQSSPAIAHLSRAQALAREGARVAIDTPKLDGSLALKGARFDDLRLKDYRDTPDPKSPEIVLLAPKGTDHPYYAQFGWIAGGPGQPVPDNDTVWKQVGGDTLALDRPVVLQWDNGHGLIFTRRIAVDEKYMFTVTDSVKNKSAAGAKLFPYGSVMRDGVPKVATTWILHQGFVGVSEGTLNEANYDDFKNPGTPPKTFSSTGGWVGITDKYWMAAIIPPQNAKFEGSYLGIPLDADTKAYQADYRLEGQALAPGATIAVTHRLFAGAKVVDTLRAYGNNLGIAHFDLAVDWGWFWFITQPLFWLLDIFYKFIGNFGLAILMLTVVVKALFFPLANASFRSMSKMKKVQPQMEEIKKRFTDDPQRQQQEIMALYKREKVNPVSGCLPMLIQIPVFFSLYKVLYVTIEMRQAPFYGWIHDLSAPDPTSILNLFGLLPYHIPAFIPAYLSVGAWPIFMGITQWVQTKLNPPPADPVQAKMFAFMPLIFTCMFATFPAGLVIYYTWNNLLGVTQQYFIMRGQGVKVHLFENFKWPKKGRPRE